MGLKADDRDTLPLCLRCHHDLHALSGSFKGWSKQQLRDWQVAQVEGTLELLGMLSPDYDDCFCTPRMPVAGCEKHDLPDLAQALRRALTRMGSNVVVTEETMDGAPLFEPSHTLPLGGTYSNTTVPVPGPESLKRAIDLIREQADKPLRIQPYRPPPMPSVALKRICPGCRGLDGEHVFDETCTLTEPMF